MRHARLALPLFAVWTVAAAPALGQGRFPPNAPNTPHRGVFPHVQVAPPRDGPVARTADVSPAIPVPRNARGRETPDLSDRLARNVQLAAARGQGAPWMLDTGAVIERAYPVRERFDGWSYGVYWNRVTRQWERGWHTVEFGLDPDYYR